MTFLISRVNYFTYIRRKRASSRPLGSQVPLLLIRSVIISKDQQLRTDKRSASTANLRGRLADYDSSPSSATEKVPLMKSPSRLLDPFEIAFHESRKPRTIGQDILYAHSYQGRANSFPTRIPFLPVPVAILKEKYVDHQDTSHVIDWLSYSHVLRYSISYIS